MKTIDAYRMPHGAYDTIQIRIDAGQADRSAAFDDIFDGAASDGGHTASALAPAWQALLNEAQRRNAALPTNTTPARGRGPAPARVVLPAEIGADWRKLAAALDDAAPEELARLLGESYRRRPVETLTALGPLILRMRQDETA